MEQNTNLGRKIEELRAEMAKAGVDSVMENQNRNKLVAMLLEYKKCGAFGKAMDCAKTVEEVYGYNKYMPEVFTEAYLYAEENYGKLDEKTGEPIPYLKLFNYCYSLKKADGFKALLTEQEGINQEMKTKKARSLIYKLAKIYGIKVSGDEINFNILNREKNLQFLKAKGFPEEAMQWMSSVLDDACVTTENVAAEEGSDYEDLLLHDKVVWNNHRYAQVLLDKLVYRLDKTMRKAKTDVAKKYLKIAVTAAFSKYEPSCPGLHYDLVLMEYIDKKLLAAMLQDTQKDCIDVACEMYGMKRENVLRGIKKLVAEPKKTQSKNKPAQEAAKGAVKEAAKKAADKKSRKSDEGLSN